MPAALGQLHVVIEWFLAMSRSQNPLSYSMISMRIWKMQPIAIWICSIHFPKKLSGDEALSENNSAS
jgi:hypothetical protein